MKTSGSIFSDNSQALILCFHDIDGGGKYAIKSKQLKAILERLKGKYEVLSLKDWLVKQPKKPTVVLTFDDGFPSIHSKVIPMLKSYNMGATFFHLLRKT